MPQWHPLVGGVLFAAVVCGTATLVPIPRAFRWVAVAALLAVGLGLGIVTGRLVDGGWRTRVRYGAVVGGVAGVGTGVVLWAGMNLYVILPKHTVLWSIAYGLATSGVVTGDLVAAYGGALTVGYAVALATLFLVESAVAAGAAGDSSDTAVDPSR